MNLVRKERRVRQLNIPDNHIVGPKNPETDAIESDSTVGTQLSTLY